MSIGAITVVVEEPAWKTSGVRLSRVKTVARLALGAASTNILPAGPKAGRFALTILLAGDARLRALNSAFRNKDCATNVLSFPAAENSGAYLGDIAIALGVTSAEAARAGIALEAHTLHLVAHGVLHLLGYDHVRAREAKIMERLEIVILDRLGIADPYAPTAIAR